MCTVDLMVSVVKSMDLGGRRKGRGEISQRTPQGSLQTCCRPVRGLHRALCRHAGDLNQAAVKEAKR